MWRSVCRVKLHRLTVTEANLHYTGSLTLDLNLMKAGDLTEGELVHVANLTNGQRFETYVIEGPAGSGVVCLNGAAARCGVVGDQIIVMVPAMIEPHEVAGFRHRVVHVNDSNQPVKDGGRP